MKTRPVVWFGFAALLLIAAMLVMTGCDNGSGGSNGTVDLSGTTWKGRAGNPNENETAPVTVEFKSAVTYTSVTDHGTEKVTTNGTYTIQGDKITVIDDTLGTLTGKYTSTTITISNEDMAATLTKQ
ncbi:MAG: hypothetical protein LBB78_02570 [Spirochaetaceae bacterium]|jgi:hypothetical protein|nr:hypothetical protein [Spirochaetaceae bacterium]